MDDPSENSPSESDRLLEGRWIRRGAYGQRVTVIIILVCCLLFLGGIWVTEIDLGRMIEGDKLFDAKQDICVRTVTLPVRAGQGGRIKLCVEWIDQSDMSGRTRELSLERIELVEGSDGKVRARVKSRMNLNLLGVTGFLIAIILGGRAVQRYLIKRFEKQLGLTS